MENGPCSMFEREKSMTGVRHRQIKGIGIALALAIAKLAYPEIGPFSALDITREAASADGFVTVSEPSWGKVAAPSTGTAYYLLDYNSGAVSRLTSSGYAFNDGQNGEYTFSGQFNQAISYSVSFGAFTGTGVSVVSSVINGNVD